MWYIAIRSSAIYKHIKELNARLKSSCCGEYNDMQYKWYKTKHRETRRVVSTERKHKRKSEHNA